jgi:hypothetical protein
MSTVGLVALVAQPTTPPADPGGRGEDFGKSSPVALVVLILFFVAVYFLIRSMNKHLRKIQASFDDTATPAEPAPAEKDAPQS